ncbi:MAG: hypothetical protein AAF998_22810 [Bacteroidota bacterium]
MKRIVFLFCLTLSVLACPSCGDTQAPETAKPNFLDSLYNPARYRALLDSLQRYEILTPVEMDDFKAYMRENGDFITGEWTYGDIHTNAQGSRQMLDAPIGLTINGLTPRTDRKIVEFRFELDFKNVTAVDLQRFHAVLVTLDTEGKELDRSPRFSVAESLAPEQSSGELRLQYAYYRPTGNEMNQPKNERQRRKVDAMLQQARDFDPDNYRLEVSDVLLANGMTARAYWRLRPEDQAQQASAPVRSTQIGLLKWADQNPEWIAKLRDPVSKFYLCPTPILTDKYESTHGPYLIFDRIEKFNGFFTGQKKVPRRKITGSTQGKLLLDEMIDFWGWPTELRIYEQ